MMWPCVAFKISFTSSLLVFIRFRGFFSDVVSSNMYIFCFPFCSSGTLTTSMLDYLILSINYWWHVHFFLHIFSLFSLFWIVTIASSSSLIYFIWFILMSFPRWDCYFISRSSICIFYITSSTSLFIMFRFFSTLVNYGKYL